MLLDLILQSTMLTSCLQEWVGLLGCQGSNLISPDYPNSKPGAVSQLCDYHLFIQWCRNLGAVSDSDLRLEP